MVSLPLLLPFALATVVLMLIPGPNVALIVANSLAGGVRCGLLTVAGTASAMVLQLVVVALGLAGLLAGLGHAFGWLRWLGAGYLVLLGIRQWRAAPVDLSQVPPSLSRLRTIWTRAFLVSLTNPKTLLFYGAFFPQFIAPHRPQTAQLAVLCAVFLLLAVTLDSGWALAASRARPLLARHGRWRYRLSGGVLVCAAAGLALSRAA